VAITLRADVPFYRLNRDFVYTYPGYTPTGPAYVFEVPVSLICSMGY
jgi:hypothetical protein